ncbi:MAG: hypothetical protein WC817_03655 [Patescibacteria group bacterium]|jgi:hypothetical protein
MADSDDNDQELGEEEENLLAELLGEFSDEVREGKRGSTQWADILDRCTSQAMREEFIALASLDQAFETIYGGQPPKPNVH